MTGENQPKEADWTIKDFKFHSGETIPELRIHYTTLGEPTGQPQGWRGVLSPHDQQQFDSYYSKWVDATKKNDQDDIAGNARHM